MKKEIYDNLDYFNNLLEKFILNEYDSIAMLGYGIEDDKYFKFFLTVLIHSIYENSNDSLNYIDTWIFMILNGMVDRRYLNIALNYTFTKKIKIFFKDYFKKIKV